MKTYISFSAYPKMRGNNEGSGLLRILGGKTRIYIQEKWRK